MDCKALIINLGSTSTKLAVYQNTTEEHSVTVHHTAAEIAAFSSVWEQKQYRIDAIFAAISGLGHSMKDFNIIACRGGNTRPVPGGTYVITEKMLDDIRSGQYGVHATGLGDIIAFELGREYHIPAITADLPVTDELIDEARFSGLKEYPRISSFHALNQKRTARVYAERMGKRYEDLALIVVHLGGGISVGAHDHGRVIDVNNALDGEGPFSPGRCGTIAAQDIVRLCYDSGLTRAEVFQKINSGSGLMSYLGTNDAREVERRITEGDEYAKAVYDAMAYQVAREIGAAAVTLLGHVDAIVLTGSLAYSDLFTKAIESRVAFLSGVVRIPGENEMVALAEHAYGYLNGEPVSNY